MMRYSSSSISFVDCEVLDYEILLFQRLHVDSPSALSNESGLCFSFLQRA